MKHINLILLLIFFITIPALAYEVYNYSQYKYQDNSQNLLFIIDFSNSMGEYLGHKTKISTVKKTLMDILPEISKETNTGIRVYGHNCNIFAFNACRNSELLVPIQKNSHVQLNNAISKLRPRGMTPITYSLKQAIKKDFNNINGNKHIILLTDGGENCDESPCDYAISLIKERKDINIDVIAFNVENENDLAQLQCTAEVTSGKFINATTNAELFNSMQELIKPHLEVEAILYNKFMLQ